MFNKLQNGDKLHTRAKNKKSNILKPMEIIIDKYQPKD